MKRNEIIENIKVWTYPLGPFCDVDITDYNEYVKFNNSRYSTLEESSIDILIDMLLNPPSKDEVFPADIEEFTDELVYALSYVGQKNAKDNLIKLEEILKLSKVRCPIIDVIGGLKHKDGIKILKELLEEELSYDEVLHIVDNLGEIGGHEAEEILLSLKDKYGDRYLEILKEIDMCLSNIKLNLI